MKAHIKAHIIAALVAVQMTTAGPAAAAELIEDRAPSAQRRGAFAGARLRIPFGGGEKAHGGLAVTATRRDDMSGTLILSKGVEFGFAGDRKPRLSIAGRPIDMTGQARAGVSTLGWVGIGVAGVALTLGIAYLAFTEAMDCDAGEECN